jgi:cyclophilin family peptidyl-prolyl cis-trans isomerase
VAGPKKRAVERRRRKLQRLYIAVGVLVAVGVVAGAFVALTPGTATLPPGTLPGYAIINTASGQMVMKFFEAEAPTTCHQFIGLIQEGYYNGLTWHRVVAGFVIQTGNKPQDPRGTIPLELNAALHNYRGFVGVARTTDPNSGSTQFYINLGNNSNLDTSGGGYAVFAQVTRGMEVADRVPQDEIISNITFLRSATPP